MSFADIHCFCCARREATVVAAAVILLVLFWAIGDGRRDVKRLAQVETSDEALSANKKKPTMATTTTNEARQVSWPRSWLRFELANRLRFDDGERSGTA